jgi:hypothetical protein
MYITERSSHYTVGRSAPYISSIRLRSKTPGYETILGMPGFRSTIVLSTSLPPCCTAEAPCIVFLRTAMVELLLHTIDGFQQVFVLPKQ